MNGAICTESKHGAMDVGDLVYLRVLSNKRHS